ncbi:MAG: class I SAM-dependent methyltransferase [Thermoanaerobaculia bacterium]|nr:class I SAM-dependent methyltransferase [Thermoanaerobaculia bacterium]
MGNPLPILDDGPFIERLRQIVPRDTLAWNHLRPGWEYLLWYHYEEMRRWNPRLSLIGPGTASEVVERHYSESLQALPLLADDVKSRRRTLVDVGSGAGFPGLILAASRIDLDVVLVEPNQRKCAFLEAALRRLRRVEKSLQRSNDERTAPLSCRVQSARVDGPIGRESGWPDSVDLITSRALAWNPRIHQSLSDRWPSARFLLWIGHQLPPMPSAAWVQRDLSLGRRGRIVEIAAE